TWTFTTEPGATTECRLGTGATTVFDYAPCNGSVTYDLTGQPDGDYQVSVRATDVAGNTGAPAASTYSLDTTGPDVTITSTPSSPGALPMSTWSFTTEAGATTECRLTGPSGVVSAFSACTSPASYDLSSQPDGDYTFDVRSTDAVGNT